MSLSALSPCKHVAWRKKIRMHAVFISAILWCHRVCIYLTSPRKDMFLWPANLILSHHIDRSKVNPPVCRVLCDGQTPTGTMSTSPWIYNSSSRWPKAAVTNPCTQGRRNIQRRSTTTRPVYGDLRTSIPRGFSTGLQLQLQLPHVNSLKQKTCFVGSSLLLLDETPSIFLHAEET